MPMAAVVDWFVDIPKNQIVFQATLLWLLCPIGYVTYSLIRGQIVGWYPYPFLNPGVHGNGSLALTSAGLLTLGAALVLVLTRFTPRNGGRPLTIHAS
jgi:hypothetical protein